MRPAPQKRRAGESCNPPFVCSKLMPKRATQPHFTMPPKTQRSRRSLRGTEKYPNFLCQHHYTPWGSVPVALPRSPLLLPSRTLTPSLGSRLGAPAGSGGRRNTLERQLRCLPGAQGQQQGRQQGRALSSSSPRGAGQPCQPAPWAQVPVGLPADGSQLERGQKPLQSPGACSGQSSAAWRRGHWAGPGTSRPISAAPRS